MAEYRFTSTSPDGSSVEFVLTLDVGAIAKTLAPKMRKSKNGKATAMHGAVKAIIVKRPDR